MGTSVAWIVLFLAVILLFSWALSPLVQAGWVLPWGVERIHAQCVWDNNNDKMIDSGANAGDNVTIAVIDSGVWYWDDAGGRHYHPDLDGNIVGGCTFTYIDGYVDVDCGYYCDTPRNHGTHVTGTIAAIGNAGGLVGVAPRAKIYALKCASVDGLDSISVALEVAAAINWAISYECNASIISISLGWAEDFIEVRQACWNAYDRGVLIVAAAADERRPLFYPAAYCDSIESVVAVGDTCANDTRNQDCNHCGSGWCLFFMAPGVNINSTICDEMVGWSYGVKKGSSMAVPHVTGTAALIFKSKLDSWYDFNENGKWEGCEVAWKPTECCLSLGNWTEYGFGLVNPWESIQRPDGDVNNDLKVNVKDVATVSRAYGSYPGDPLWQARADINIDNKVDVKDIAIVAKNYGKEDP